MHWHTLVTATLGWMVACIACQGSPSAAVAPDPKTETPVPKAGDQGPNPSSTIALSADVFREFMEKRDEYKKALLSKRLYTARPNVPPSLYVRGPNEVIELRRATLMYPLARANIGKLATALRYFPEIERAQFTVADLPQMPEEFCRGLGQLRNLRSLVFVNSCGEFSDEAMRLLSQSPSLEYIDLGNTQISEKGFAHLANCKELGSAVLGGNVTPRCFVPLAKLPHFNTLIVTPGAAFARPIDAETERAIASLNGRAMSIFIEEGSILDVSLFRALCKIKTMRDFYTESPFGGMTMADYEAVREWKELTRFQLAWAPLEFAPEERAKAQKLLNETEKRAQKNAEDQKARRMQSP